MNDKIVQTPADVRAWLCRHGVTVTEWANAHGFEPETVFSLLNGRTRGTRGTAYRAAVALGLRSTPSAHEQHPLNLGSARIASITSPNEPTSDSGVLKGNV
jgi:gp16 family phage-associated protein